MERRFPLSTNVERGLGGEANVRGGQGVRSRSEVEREPPAFGLQPPAITQQEEGLPIAVQLRETALPPRGELRQALLELCLESSVVELVQLAQVRSVRGVHLTLKSLPSVVAPVHEFVGDVLTQVQCRLGAGAESIHTLRPPLHTVERGTGGEDHTVQRGSREPGAGSSRRFRRPAPCSVRSPVPAASI